MITPKMKGVYSIAEAVEDGLLRSKKTIFAYMKKDEAETFDKDQLKSLKQVGKMIIKNGSVAFESLDEVVEYLNNL